MAKSKVAGLEVFRDHMKGLEEGYVIIGGTACDILLSDVDLAFRATRDFDTVLIADANLPEVASAIWSLVKDGGYRCGWGADNTCFYRFTEPQVSGYPYMIELFCKAPGFLTNVEGVEVGPIHVDDEVSSLSAILLDGVYYEYLRNGVEQIDGVSVLDALHLIPFKAKAYLDLSRRKRAGEHVDSRKISKHKNDTVRLAQLLTGDEGLALPDEIKHDMRLMIEDLEASPVRLKQIGMQGMDWKDVLAVLRGAYSL